MPNKFDYFSILELSNPSVMYEEEYSTSLHRHVSSLKKKKKMPVFHSKLLHTACPVHRHLETIATNEGTECHLAVENERVL
jgi:hypothetical protein